LIQHVEKNLRVSEVLTEIGYLSILAGLLQVIVEPSGQDDFRSQLLDVLELFTLLSELHDLWSIFERDLLHYAHPDGLPQATQHHMWYLIDKVIGINTNHFDTQSLSSSNSHIEIFLALIHIHIGLFIHGSNINTLRVDLKQEFVQQDTIVKDVEERIVFRVHW